MTIESKDIPQNQKWVLAAMFGLPLALMAAKASGLSSSALLLHLTSLEHLTPHLQHKLAHVLFVPLAAVLVVFFRLTLGIRVLGPFRSILLAIAFQITGVALGLVFLVLTVTVIVAIRPLLKIIRLPYFGRVSVMLGAVAWVIVMAVMIGDWSDTEILHRVAYFPMIVLCLIAEAMAKTLAEEGMASALWRGATTALVGVLLAGLAAIPGLAPFMVRYPETLIIEIAAIVLIAQRFDWRLLQGLNPKPVGPKGRTGAMSANQSASGIVAPTMPRA